MNSIASEYFFVKYLLFFRYLALIHTYRFMHFDRFVFRRKTLLFLWWKIAYSDAAGCASEVHFIRIWDVEFGCQFAVGLIPFRK